MKGYHQQAYIGVCCPRYMDATADIYETTYHVDWSIRGELTVWRANFLDYESYNDFVSQDGIQVLGVTTTQR